MSRSIYLFANLITKVWYVFDKVKIKSVLKCTVLSNIYSGQTLEFWKFCFEFTDYYITFFSLLLLY